MNETKTCVPCKNWIREVGAEGTAMYVEYS